MSASEGRPEAADLRRVSIHRDYWYPLARTSTLKKGRTLAANFAGEPIVLARTAQGEVFALEDRCAHRQLPLHMGVINGQQLQCCYYGWCYDKSGRLVRIPYLANGGRVPAAARGVRAYPCREAYGLIFVFPGKPELAETAELPHIPQFSSTQYRAMYFERTLDCHYTFMHENLWWGADPESYFAAQASAFPRQLPIIHGSTLLYENVGYHRLQHTSEF